jgi:hypothetical protein
LAAISKDPIRTAKQVGTNMKGAGEAVLMPRENMKELKEQLQRVAREIPNFDELTNHIDMTDERSWAHRVGRISNGNAFLSSKMSPDGADGSFVLTEEFENCRTSWHLRDTRIQTACGSQQLWELQNCGLIAQTRSAH